MKCSICGKLHHREGSLFCGFCAKRHVSCTRCNSTFRIDPLAVTRRANLCSTCMLTARGLCTSCGKAIFDSETVAQRVGRRGAQANILCLQCYQAATPLLHTDLPAPKITAQELWGHDKKLLEDLNKLTVVLSPYTPLIPTWMEDIGQTVLLRTICQGLPKVETDCYISAYPDSVLGKAFKLPPYFGFSSFHFPPVLAKELRSPTPFHTCFFDSLYLGWPGELYGYLNAVQERTFASDYPSPLSIKSREVVEATLLVPMSKLPVLAKAVTQEGGN